MTKPEILYPGWLFRLVKFLFAGTLFVASIAPSWVRAQTTDDPWAVPLNLSHSGVATNPAIVIDSDGVVHVVWEDDLSNYIYSRLDGDQWSVPETTDLNLLFGLPLVEATTAPNQLSNYAGQNPLLIAGSDQLIDAFWITPDGRVFTSSVPNQNFERGRAWDSEILITSGVATFAAAQDARGDLHLAFLRTADETANPPGIYYTRSKNRSRSWAKPVLLYESPYYRTLGEGEAHLSLATGGTEDAGHVYIAWDNRPRKQVFMAQSMDGGESWEQPAVVAGPIPNSGLAGPFNIQVGANQNSVVLVWQSGRPGGACSQLYQSSSDAGTTWNDPQPMIEDLLGCAESNEFVTGLPNDPEDPLYFLTETQSQVFLSAWNGLQWSQPQAQPILSGFEEHEIYTQVVYGCRQASRSGEHLYVIGCDESGGGDVWVTSRDLGSNVSFFSLPLWSQPSPVTSENLKLEAVELVATDDGLIHAFFSEDQGEAVYYTYWDGDLWSRISPVLELPDGEAGWPAVAAGPGNELFIITSNKRGALYFSRGSSGIAATESLWSTATRLDLVHEGEIGSVDVAWAGAQTIYVAYSVPVNSERGIYLVQSRDNGTSWSEPIQVFDGAAAGFDLVGAPTLQISENGILHILWKEQSIQGDGVPQPLALYYTRSEDGGQTFSDAAIVVEEPVAWREIVTDGNGNLHLLWQPLDTLTTVWDQISLDGGRSWQFPQGLHREGIVSAIMVDSVGRLHLVDAGPGFLGHWSWTGNWQQETPLHWSLDSQQDGIVEVLAAAVNKQGNMVAVMTVLTGTGDSVERIPLYSTRTLELPTTEPTNQDSPTPTLLSPTQIPAASIPEQSSTAVSTEEGGPAISPGQTDPTEANNRISPLIMALLPVGLLLLIALGIVVRRAAKVKDR